MAPLPYLNLPEDHRDIEPSLFTIAPSQSYGYYPQQYLIPTATNNDLFHQKTHLYHFQLFRSASSDQPVFEQILGATADHYQTRPHKKKRSPSELSLENLAVYSKESGLMLMRCPSLVAVVRVLTSLTLS